MFPKCSTQFTSSIRRRLKNILWSSTTNNTQSNRILSLRKNLHHFSAVTNNFGEMPNAWHLEHRRLQAWWIINRRTPSQSFTRIANIFHHHPPKIRFISVITIENRCYQFKTRDVDAPLINKFSNRKVSITCNDTTMESVWVRARAELNPAIYSFLRTKAQPARTLTLLTKSLKRSRLPVSCFMHWACQRRLGYFKLNISCQKKMKKKTEITNHELFSKWNLLSQRCGIIKAAAVTMVLIWRALWTVSLNHVVRLWLTHFTSINEPRSAGCYRTPQVSPANYIPEI